MSDLDGFEKYEASVARAKFEPGTSCWAKACQPSQIVAVGGSRLAKRCLKKEFLETTTTTTTTTPFFIMDYTPTFDHKLIISDKEAGRIISRRPSPTPHFLSF